MLVRRCKILKDAARDAENVKDLDFTKREKESALMHLSDKRATRKHSIEVRPFGLDAFGAPGPAALQDADQF